MHQTLWKAALCGALAICLGPMAVLAATQESEALFTNTYTATGSYTPEGTKTLVSAFAVLPLTMLLMSSRSPSTSTPPP